MEGVDLTVAEEALGAIARKAIDRKTGARGQPDGAYAEWTSDRNPTIGREAAVGGLRQTMIRRGVSAGRGETDGKPT